MALLRVVVVIFLGVFVIDARLAFADNEDVIYYLTNTLRQRDKADAENIFMESPGTTAVIQESGSNITKVKDKLDNILVDKELLGLNWGLYSTVGEGKTLSGGTAVSSFLDQHKMDYCSPFSGVETKLDGKTCGKDKNPEYMQHADLRISTLLNSTIYANDDEKRHAGNTIRTLTVPFPDFDIKQKVNEGMAKADDQKIVANAMVQNAIINVARNSLNEMWGIRASEDMAEKPPHDIFKSLHKPKLKSVLGVMEEEAERRFKGKDDWYKKVDESSGEALLREMVQMEAFKLWMDYHKYRQSERIEALLAVATAFNVRQSARLTKMLPDQ